MANTNIQQEYPIGEPFNTYTAAELSAKDSTNWKWTYRTLTGFMREDGTIVPVGDQTQFNEDRAQVSGIWELDKFRGDPLKIYFIGTGSVSATVIEHSETLPLANTTHPYEYTHGVFDSSTQQSASISDFYLTDTDTSKISVVLSCAPGTYLNRVYGIANNYLHQYNPHTTSSLLEYNKPFYNYTAWWDSGLCIDNDISYTCRLFRTLSVHFTSAGILEYIPNTNTLNPDHPDPNN